MTMLVTGARGNVGSRVLNRLHAAGHALRASSRKPSDLSVPKGVETVTLDLNDAGTFAPALAGVTKVFLYAEPEGIKDLLKAAEAAGVEHIVLLSSNTVVLPDAMDDPLALHHSLVEKALVDSGLSYTILRPGAFAGNALGWSYPIQGNQPIEQAYPEAQVATVHEDDIADVAVVALTEGSLAGQAVTLTGPESLTFREQLSIIAELLGRDIPVRELSREEAAEKMGKFVPAPILTSLLNQWKSAVGKPADTSETAERITGKPARTFRLWVEENLGAFGGKQK